MDYQNLESFLTEIHLTSMFPKTSRFIPSQQEATKVVYERFPIHDGDESFGYLSGKSCESIYSTTNQC